METQFNTTTFQTASNSDFQSLGGQHAAGDLISKSDRPAALVSRNIVIANKRTSIRLEPSMWDALEEICIRERCNIHQVCSLVASRLSCSSFTAAVRGFVLSNFRAATTELGHAAAGHGQLKGLNQAKPQNTNAQMN